MKVRVSPKLELAAVVETLFGDPVQEIVDRLLAKTLCDGLRGCWLWNGFTISGYGSISIHDQQRYIHRIAFAIFNGPIPDGGVVRHDCDMPRCWNPAHLLCGTQLDNIADMHERGRNVNPPALHGAAHPKATLTADQVSEIRRRGIGRQRATAQEFGVSQSTIWRILHGATRARG